MDKNFEYMRVASAVASLKIGDPNFNGQEIAAISFKAGQEMVKVLVFPELSMTGYTCQDY